ncbi:hypothetical protein BTJ39_20715 [Izhakiella australiensis]|uniref:Proline racemase n=1 Tax=Izhakiella australiensis TaxID=1926881 RepID=A0A1S8YD52_9GAMM|nr:proline racemase family protein [Izhakiella australiensis]OON37024.1 hypothetical protein BTJ39_20715 [Izhakiella australiensis]
MSAPFRLPAAVDAWLEKEQRQAIGVVDSHTGGNPTRIVLSGITLPQEARTVDSARSWLRDHADHWRRRLVHEPRGGGLTCAVLPVYGKQDGCDIGAVFLEPGAYPPMCGHCTIGFASVIIELGLLPELPLQADGSVEFNIRTPAGAIGIEARRQNGQLVDITMINVESYCISRSQCLVEGRAMDVELLYGGDYYISVDAERIGLSLQRDNASEIVRLARQIRSAYTRDGVRDPANGERLDVYQVLFYQHHPAEPGRAKIVVVAPPGVIDRSPCGTGSSAFYARLVTMGLLKPDDVLTTSSIIDSTFTVTARRVRSEGSRLMITPALTGRARINGFLLIAADAGDELADGFAPL